MIDFSILQLPNSFPGLHLTKDEQDQIKEIKKRMSDLGIDFNNYINEEKTSLEFTQEELGEFLQC